MSAGVIIRHFNAIHSSISGKDKALKLIQYTLKLLSSILKNNSSLHALLKVLFKKMNDLESAISISRNVFSFGSNFESLISALDALGIADDSLRVWSVAAHSFKFVHLSFDHLNLIQKIKLTHVSDSLALWVNRLWTLSALLNLAKSCRRARLLCNSYQDIFSMPCLARKLKDDRNEELSFRKLDVTSPRASKGQMQLQEMKLNVYKDILDLICALTNLGFFRSEIGASSGILSSIIALFQILRKVN